MKYRVMWETCHVMKWGPIMTLTLSLTTGCVENTMSCEVQDSINIKLT